MTNVQQGRNVADRKYGHKVRCERKAEVKWLDVSIDLQRSNPMRQLYICKMLFLNDKR